MAWVDTAAYLRRLGLDQAGPPSAARLHALHRAHVERVPYEAIEIQLACATTVDPYESAARIVNRRRGGYCYHLNGAFSLLLARLGYDVIWHRGGVQPLSAPEPVGATGNHLALTVHGLPSDDNPHGSWLVDAGLGDALHAPLPLIAGTYHQGPFTYELQPSTAEPGGWRFEHDPRGSFIGMDFRPTPATTKDFKERHQYLSTSPDSPFVQTCSVQRRDATGVDVLTGCVLKRLPREDAVMLDDEQAWFDALHEVFGLPLDDIDRARLWRRVKAAHGEWLQYSR
jgi:N-hydroxyarylamine O-acetyltransferase